MPCAAHFQQSGSTAIANISGRLDAEAASDLEAILTNLRNEAQPRLVANLAAAGGLDKVCLLRILQESRSLSRQQRQLILIAPAWLAQKPGTVLSTLEAQGLTVYMDPAAAAAALDLSHEVFAASSAQEDAAGQGNGSGAGGDLLQELQGAVSYWKDTILHGPDPQPLSDASLSEVSGGQSGPSLAGDLKDGLKYWLGKLSGRS